MTIKHFTLRGLVALSCLALCSGLPGCGPAATTTDVRHEPAIAPPPAAPPSMDTVLPFWGHRSPVDALEFSADGQVVYSVAAGEEVIAWSPHDGAARRKYTAEGLGDTLTGFIVDPEGDYIALGDSAQIWFWDARSGRETRRIELPPSDLPGENKARITKVAPAGNRDFLLVGDDLGRLLIIDIEKGSAEKVFRTDLRGIDDIVGNRWATITDGVNTMTLDLSKPAVPLPVMGELEGLPVSDLNRSFVGRDEVVVASLDNHIMKWGPDFTTPPTALADELVIHDLTVDRNEALALVATPDGLALFDLDKNKRSKVEFELAIDPTHVAIDPNGLYVASAELNQIVIRQLKKTRTGNEGRVLHRMHHAVLPRFMVFEPRSHRFLVAGNDGRPTRYDLDQPATLSPFKNVSSPIVDGVLALESNGYYATTRDGSIVVFDYEAGRIARDLAVDIGPSPHIAMSESRMAIVSELRGLTADETTRRGELVVYDLREDKILSSLNVTDAIDVEFAPAGGKIYYAGRSAVIESWNFENQQRKKAFDDLSSKAHRLRLSPGGVQLALVGDGGVTFYNPSLEPVAGAELPGAVDIAFAFDGTTAAVATEDHSVYLVHFIGDDKVTTEPVVKAPTRVTSLAFSSDGRYLLVGESRGTVSVMDLKTKNPQPLATLQIIDESHWLTYTPDGAWLGNPPDNLRFDLDGEIAPSVGGQGVKWRQDPRAVEAALKK